MKLRAAVPVPFPFPFLVFVAFAISGCSSGTSFAPPDAGAPSITVPQAIDASVVNILYSVLGEIEGTGASWYKIGDVASSGACSGGSYRVSGTISGSTAMYTSDLTFVLQGCTYTDAQGTNFAYSGSVTIDGTTSGSGTSAARNVAMSSSALTIVGSLPVTNAGVVDPTTVSGYDACVLDANVPTSLVCTGTVCGRTLVDPWAADGGSPSSVPSSPAAGG